VQTKSVNAISYNGGRWEKNRAAVIIEQPVTLSINNNVWLTFMCTPLDLEPLAVGFLYNENIIQSLDDIASIRVCPGGDNVDIWLNIAVKKPENWKRTSGCSGGTTSVNENNLSIGITNRQNGNSVAPEMINLLVTQLINSQNLYRKSGGVHTSALSDGEKLFLVAEDIGRHNTLDKLTGRLLLERTKPNKIIVLTTGRISSEMIQKAIRMGATIVISRTSPTSLSVQMAEKSGVTLIGYVRGEHFTIYAHPERIQVAAVGEVSFVRQND
jgi:FdhD protein